MPQEDPAGVEEQLICWLVLAGRRGLTPRRLKHLFNKFRQPSPFFSLSDLSLASLGFSPQSVAKIGPELRRPFSKSEYALAEAGISWSRQPGNKVLTWNDPAYPSLLFEIPDAPPLLYVSGNYHCLSLPQIAVVGSRRPSADGRRNTRFFVTELAHTGFQICSGLAMGIDSESHQAAITAGTGTVAVLGTGIDKLYPQSRSKLAEVIAENGAVISEFPLGTEAFPANFPRRNRIISGLSYAVLVIEAARRSGSLITARVATEQGREVFAVPGSIHNPMTRGCHHLIRQGAKLAEKVDDITEELGAILDWHKQSHASVSGQQRINNNPTADKSAGATAVEQKYCENNSKQSSLPKPVRKVLEHIGYEPVSLDSLCHETKLEVEKLSVILMELELAGLINNSAGAYALNKQ